MKSAWLVEFVGATPCPVYASDGPWYTCDPWEAKWFATKEEAEAWMFRPGIVGYGHPWKAISHGFITTEERECICAEGVTKCPKHGPQPAHRDLCPLCSAPLGYCIEGEYCTRDACKYVN